MNQESSTICNISRKETLESLKHLDDGLDAVIAQGNYFRKVDNRNGINNYSNIVKDVTKKCEKLANPKLWVPINPNVNLENLIQKLGLVWPSKAEVNFNHIQNVFDDIDASYTKKGLKSTMIPGVPKPRPNDGRNQPVQRNDNNKRSHSSGRDSGTNGQAGFNGADDEYNPIMNDERVKGIDKKIVERILTEVKVSTQTVSWDDIAGLENVKQALADIIIYPLQNPEIYQGVLAPDEGLLLFGPPGTGKTLIGKCIARECGATFFDISSSSLTSKWVGEGEATVRALFAVARCMQPSVIFIDEIDSLLTQRVDGENDSSRKIKTEFLKQTDGVSTGGNSRVLLVGTTNMPHELDKAALRRFTQRFYIPLPDDNARKQIVRRLLGQLKNSLTEEDINYLAERSVGYSGADMSNLCRKAGMNMMSKVVRARGGAHGLSTEDLPPVTRLDFDEAFNRVKPTVSQSTLAHYENWNREFGARD